MKHAGFPYGAAACEVEVDCDTGVIDIVGYWAVDDVGTVINPMIVEGQVRGGIAHGIGNALFEQMAPFVRQTISRIDQLGEQADRFTSALAAVAAFSRVDPWHHDGWLFALMRHLEKPLACQILDLPVTFHSL